MASGADGPRGFADLGTIVRAPAQAATERAPDKAIDEHPFRGHLSGRLTHPVATP